MLNSQVVMSAGSPEGANIVFTVIVSITCSILLWGIYRGISSKWPESYTSIESQFDELIRFNPVRSILLFRGAPAFLITLMMAVIIERRSGDVWIAYCILIILHIGQTHLQAIWRLITDPRPNGGMVFLLHILSIVTVIIFAALAIVSRRNLDSIIPSEKELISGAWTALFFAVIAVTARAILSPREVSGRARVEMLMADAGAKVWNSLSRECRNEAFLESVARAIILAEVEQRPKWLRNVENLKGLIFRSGTYGVAQVSSSYPINDEQSIVRLVNFLREKRISSFYDIHDSDLRSILLEHNPDERHVGRVIEIYEMCRYYSEELGLKDSY